MTLLLPEGFFYFTILTWLYDLAFSSERRRHAYLLIFPSQETLARY